MATNEKFGENSEFSVDELTQKSKTPKLRKKRLRYMKNTDTSLPVLAWKTRNCLKNN